MSDDPITNLARLKGTHRLWKEQKDLAIKKLKAFDQMKGKQLADLFDQGLGPKIEEYYKEIKDFKASNMLTQPTKIWEKAKAVNKVRGDYEESLKRSKFESKEVLIAVLRAVHDHMINEMDILCNFLYEHLPQGKWPSGFPKKQGIGHVHF